VQVAGVSVLIVDDEADVRYLVRIVAQLRTDVTDIFEAADGDAALALWRSHHPDLIVMDQRMAPTTGLQAAARILDEDPGQRIVMYSSYLSDADIAESERLGIREVLSKDEIYRLTEIIAAHR
jgi:DNA-binding NarL/FixJ family response regulator